MSKTKKNTIPRLTEAWPEKDIIALEYALHDLVDDLELSDKAERVALTDKEQQWLGRQFKSSQKAQSPFKRFAWDFAENIGIMLPPDRAVKVVAMKSWERAAMKMRAPGRNLHDLGRARARGKGPVSVVNADRLLSQKGPNSFAKKWEDRGVKIIRGSVDNYITSPRTSSGYAGSINVDIETSFKKGQPGIVEMQVMPDSMEKVDKHSHRLFDMIRLLDEIPAKAKSPAQKHIQDCLTIANATLWDNAALDNGYMHLRTSKPDPLKELDIRETIRVLDRVKTIVQSLPGRNFAWKSETAEACGEAADALWRTFLRDNENVRNMMLDQFLDHDKGVS